MPPRAIARPSVYDVAAHAGVSIATVSRVLRGTARVAEPTRARVLAAADALQWRPSGLARAFVSQRHGAVGIVFPDLAGPYYSRVIGGFEEAACEARTAVLILATHGRPGAPELVADLADRVDGLVIMGRTVPDRDVRAVAERRVPVVVLARPALDGVPAVRASNTATAAALTEHLVGHGARRLVFLGNPRLSPDVAERWRGVRRVMRDVAGSLRLAVCDFDAEHGYKAAVDVFAADEQIDAVVCANDEVATGVVRAATASGRDVPGDVAVTGWDDTPLAARVRPALTTVHQPLHELGARAARALFARMGGDVVRSAVLPTALVVRESCGCPPPATPVDPHHRRDREQGGTS